MEIAFFLAAIAYLIVFMLLIRRGPADASGLPQTVDRDAWPLYARWDDKPPLEENWSVETHGWPPEGSPYWRLGGRIRSAGGGDGMMGGCGGAGGGGGDGGC